jgi:hypothetical protein
MPNGKNTPQAPPVPKSAEPGSQPQTLMRLLLDRLSDRERVEVLELARRMGARDNDAIFGVLLAFDQAGRRLLASVSKADQIPVRIKTEVEKSAAAIQAAADGQIRRIQSSTKQVEAEIVEQLGVKVAQTADRIALARAKAEAAARTTEAYASALVLVAVAVTIGSLLGDFQPAWFSQGFRAAAGAPMVVRMAYGVACMPVGIALGATLAGLLVVKMFIAVFRWALYG